MYPGPSAPFAIMGAESRFVGLVLGRGLTSRPPDAAAAAVVWVAGGSDAAAQVTFFVMHTKPTLWIGSNQDGDPTYPM